MKIFFVNTGLFLKSSNLQRYLLTIENKTFRCKVEFDKNYSN